MEDDQALFVRFQATGDGAAFETLYARHKDELFRYLRHLAGSEPAAADVFQQVWLKLLELARAGNYRSNPKSSFRGYLYALGRNHYVDAYLRKHEEARTESLPPGDALPPGTDDEATPEAEWDGARLGGILAATLAKLPREQREAALLWAQGWSINEIAQLTRAPPDTVASRRKYAIRQLKRLLAEHGITGSTA